MSAEILRAAAREARRDSMNGCDKFLDAVADWLDHAAIAADAIESLGLTYGGIEGRAPLAVAHAYLDDPAPT